jgi:signal transduction histidine kinase
MEQDYSGAIAIIGALKAQGINDLAAYSELNPDFLPTVTAAVLTTEVNDAMMEVLGISSLPDAYAPMTAFSPSPATMLEILQAIHNGKEHYHGRGTLIGLDGKQRAVLVANAFPPDIETIGRVIGALVDVTDCEKAAQEALLAARSELARASRAASVGALSASIAHELNQPLGAVVMNAQTCLRWLRKDPPDVAAAYAAAERAAGAGMRASEIVGETRALLTKRRRRDELVDLHTLVTEVIELLDREISERGASVHADLELNLPFIVADRVSIQQVLVNLVVNALHAVGDRPMGRREISIVVSRAGEDHIRLMIRDRGAGIPDETLSRLFEPFFTTKEGGMGMGLAISRMAVEARGGQLLARNHEDGGAVFECLLPTRMTHVA